MKYLFNKIYKNFYDKDNKFVCINIYFQKLENIDEKEFIKSKFKFLKYYLIPNTYNVKKKEKYKLFEIFFKIQKLIHKFYQFKRIINKKYSKSYDSELDLNLEPLINCNNNHVISLIENRTKYKFKITDIINIINNNLSFNYDFFPEPKEIKNPYTNISFSLPSLYKIYFTIKESTFLMPLLFERYFQVNFCMSSFVLYNDTLIREHNVKYFMTNSYETEKIKYIKKMIKYYNFYNKKNSIYINKDFPNKELIKVFQKLLRKYLNTYYIYKESSYKFKKKFMDSMIEFKKFNPIFGRKMFYKNIKKLYNISCYKYENDYNYLFSSYYLPPPHLIDVQNKFYFVSEMPRYISIFDLDNISNLNFKMPNSKNILNDSLLSSLFNENNKNNENEESNETDIVLPETAFDDSYHSTVYSDGLNLLNPSYLNIDSEDESEYESDNNSVNEEYHAIPIYNIQNENNDNDENNDENNDNNENDNEENEHLELIIENIRQFNLISDEEANDSNDD
jgi:hypothetical protein